jgi:hypothetical protein
LSNIEYLDELQRARGRSDVDALQRVLAEYYEWHGAFARKRAGEEVDDSDLVIDPILHDASDADRSLALVVLAMATYDDPLFLGLIAAGPLEDILSVHGDDILARIVTEARHTPRFRWMLSGVSLHSIKPENVDAVAQAVRTMTIDGDALPPRPSI